MFSDVKLLFKERALAAYYQIVLQNYYEEFPYRGGRAKVDNKIFFQISNKTNKNRKKERKLNN